MSLLIPINTPGTRRSRSSVAGRHGLRSGSRYREAHMKANFRSEFFENRIAVLVKAPDRRGLTRQWRMP